MRINPPNLRALVALTLLIAVPAQGTKAQDEFDDDYPQPGLLASYESAGVQIQRVDADLNFNWQEKTPDLRLPTGKFQASWESFLRVRSSGEYRFFVDLLGSAEIEVDGETLFASETSSRKELAGKSVQLKAGQHDLKVHFHSTTRASAMRVFWKGPKFGKEPLSPTSTLHYREDAPQPHFQRGQQLVEAARCAACHDLPRAGNLLPAPSLNRLTGNLNPGWLVDRLMASGGEQFTSSKMPHFAMTREQSRAVAAYLFSLSKGQKPKQLKKSKPPKQKRNAKPRPAESEVRGEHLFHSVGCLSCHKHNQLGNADLLSGLPLDAMQGKRPANFFQRWLTDPESINNQHRMPIFTLAAWEATDLANFLEQRLISEADNEQQADWLRSDKLIGEGRQIVASQRCNACHQIDDTASSISPKAKRLDHQSDWQNSCLGDSGDSDHQATQPKYAFNKSDRQAIKTFVSEAHSSNKLAVTSGADLLRRHNCLACHRRGAGQGNAKIAVAVAQQFSEAIEHVALVTPPSLNSAGDKFHQSALENVIRGEAKQRRPWLAIRMPKFRISDREAETLAQWLSDQDHIKYDQPNLAKVPDEDVLRTVGPRLVTTNGFGCASCHSIGDVSPVKAPPNSRGPNLAGLGKTVRAEWFRRWVADPLRVVPRVEMPAIKLPVSGVLDDDIDQQINAVWHVINLPGFRPPRPDAVRTVRHYANDNDTKAHVLTDVLRIEDTPHIKPLLVGLSNRHNVLFDMETARLAGWWIGDTAAQHTEGKTWFWEATGTNLLNNASSTPDFALVNADDRKIVPELKGQFFTEPDAWQHLPDGAISLSHRLHFRIDNRLATARVTQTFAPGPTSANGISSWRRNIKAESLPNNWSLQVALASGQQFSVVDNELTSSNGRLRIRVPQSKALRDVNSTEIRLGDGQEIAVHYETDLPVDSIEKTVPERQPPKTVKLNVVPGFAATQTTIASEILPTGFSWLSESVLFVTDLKGRVFRAEDADGNGHFESVTAFGDELAAPFGVKAYPDFVDVINKYALLRLHDADHDGIVERTETLASGWGHTTDYHDWAIGLPQSRDGSYFVAFACQQDDRTRPAARLRGKVVRLVPRDDAISSDQTPRDSQPFEIEVLSGGHRFPVGIARNQQGELFVPDNQGNYNPFNELNHVVKGKRFGFINKLEKTPDFSPPLTAPAIDIPHPWTRSVNGICFLESPQQDAGDDFGPFEGHLVGCEYDTQRLIRMSLQRVDGTIQGAAYPLSYDNPDANQPTFLGPISCAISPSGRLFVGNIRESGWGGGQNTGNIVNLEFRKDSLPAGIAEVQATHDGFIIRYTKPVDAKAAANPKNFAIESYTRISTPKYGGDDVGNRTEKIVDIRFDQLSGTTVIRLGKLREGYVYEFNLQNINADSNAEFFPDRAFYTLRKVPRKL